MGWQGQPVVSEGLPVSLFPPIPYVLRESRDERCPERHQTENNSFPVVSEGSPAVVTTTARSF